MSNGAELKIMSPLMNCDILSTRSGLGRNNDNSAVKIIIQHNNNNKTNKKMNE